MRAARPCAAHRARDARLRCVGQSVLAAIRRRLPQRGLGGGPGAPRVPARQRSAERAGPARGCSPLSRPGSGVGLNFLATWQAWRDDPHRCCAPAFRVDRALAVCPSRSCDPARAPSGIRDAVVATARRMAAAGAWHAPAAFRRRPGHADARLRRGDRSGAGLEPRRRRLLSRRVRAGPQSGDVVGATR